MKGLQTKKLVRSAMLLAIAIVFQIIGKNFPGMSQVFVGPAVNAVLIITAALCGTMYGVIVGSLTPLLAWLTAQLPAPMGPFIPFIMIGNIIFVVSYGIIKKKSIACEFIGVGIGALLKYLFLYFSASKLVKLLHIGIQKNIMGKLVIMMGLPQFVTAIIGGAIAIFIIEILNKRKAI